MFDYMVVGAGFAGSVMAERLANVYGKKVLIVEKRPHIAGNAYDHYNDDGLLVHKYGPHIFHTHSQEVFNYLSRFTEWRPYQHRVLANVEGQLLPFPINLSTLNQYFGLHLTSFDVEAFLQKLAEKREALRTAEDAVLGKVGRELYEKFFRNHARKLWGLDPSELDASALAHLPVRTNRDDRYFSDRYQVMPRHGYTRMFERMLDHPNIKVMLNTSYHEVKDVIPYRELIFTGPVDEFFDYCFGKLPYRSVHFRHETHSTARFQEVPEVSFPNEYPYTRCTEFKYLTGQEHPKTSIVYEYPTAEGEPYYPIPSPESEEQYQRYAQLAKDTPGVYFVGRLATYRNQEMDEVVAQALTLCTKMMGLRRRGMNHLQVEGHA